MKKIICLILISLLLNINTYAETSLWKISKNGNEFYLGGSIHILRPNDYPLPMEFENAFSKASTLVLETDLGIVNSPSFGQKLMMQSMLKNGQTLKTILSKKVYQQLEKECMKVGLPLSQMQMMKPSMVIMTLTVMNLQRIGLTGEGVDKNYYNHAKSSNMKFKYLESVEKQLKLLTTLGEGAENEFVQYSLNDIKNMKEDIEKLIMAWKKGDKSSMVKQIKEMKKQYPKIYHDMMVERNNSWIPSLMSYLNDKEKEMVIVGALHLYGKDGLLNLLKKKGCKVERY